TEYQRFGERVQSRISQALARSLTAGFPHADAQERLTAVETATELGTCHGLTSKKQIKTLAKCLLMFGNDFPQRYPEVAAVLSDAGRQAWQKRHVIEEWIPRARAQCDFTQRMAALREHHMTWRKDTPYQGASNDVYPNR
ncbi:hypothetical protein, partial [Vreelandella olivaria]|uniref:hypothetical protein n=1 Tax=Vreelandella olivaria TaxID=390919 RepID=UPI00201F9524